MAKTFEKEVSYALTPDALLALITTDEYVEARHRAQGALSIRVERSEPRAGSLVQKAFVTEPAHTMTGPHPSKTEDAVVTYTWDLGARHCDWRYLGKHESRVGVSGTLHISPHPKGCLLRTTFEASAAIPLIGRVIEGLIIGDIKKSAVSSDALVLEFVQRHNDAS